MAYAVVYFIDDDLTSEIPTNWLHKDENDYMCWWPPLNTKNTKSLIMKRAEPDIKTWMLLPIKVEKYCETFEKARKVAENENYTSAEDLHLGKGYRKRVPPNRYLSSDDTDSLSDERNNNNDNKKKAINSVNLQFTKGSCTRKSNKDTIDIEEYNNNAVIESHTTSKLPEWPSSIVKSKNENTCLVPTNEINIIKNKLANETTSKYDTISQHQSLPHTSTCQSVVENQSELSLYDNNHNNEELMKCIKDVKGNTEILIRMCASFDLQIKDILHHINKLTPNMRFNASTERVQNMLPLKTIDEIKRIEVLLQEESFSNEYKTFILKIGGHSPREAIRSVLSRIFSNECSIQCSWKGRRQNFGVAKLTLIRIMKDIILEKHTLTERELDDLAAEWFRFGKQRFHREKKSVEG